MGIHEIAAGQEDIAEAIALRRRRVMTAPTEMTVSEWADTFRQVPSETSNITGQWDTSMYEVARGPMDAVTEPGVHILTGIASAQIYKTSTGENAIGYFMHMNPRPILVYEPVETTVTSFVDSRLDPMIKTTPELAALWGGVEAIERKNDKFVHSKKTFPGGYVEVLTANSPANTASRSAGVVFMDEVDKFEMTRDGDPVALIDERLKSWTGDGLSIRMSTPTLEGDSPIMAEYQKSDMRKPFVECPHCGEWHYFKWANVHYKDANGKADPELAAYYCEACGAAWSEAERIKVLTTKGSISWRQTRPFTCCDERQTPETDRLWDHAGRALCRCCGDRAVSNRHAGFWAWEAYNPRPSLADLIRAWLDCQGNPGKLQNFVNSKLSETWKAAGGDYVEVDPEQFASRVDQPWPAVPAAVRLITMGVDTQPMGKSGQGRLECEVVGWGDGDESWSLGYHVLYGDPGQALGAVWSQLDGILMSDFMADDGRRLRIVATCIDTGGDQEKGGDIIDAVTKYAFSRRSLNVWPIKGSSSSGRADMWPSAARMKDAAIRNGVKVIQVGVHTIKDWISRSMGRTQPGPGFMHVPADRPASWFEQMTNVKRQVKRFDGRAVSKWVARYDGARKEAIDCRTYAKAALEGIRITYPQLMTFFRTTPMQAEAAPSDGTPAPIAQAQAQAQAPVAEPAPVAQAQPQRSLVKSARRTGPMRRR